MSTAPPRAPAGTATAGVRRAIAAGPVRVLVAVATMAILLVALVWDSEWRALRVVLTVLAIMVAPAVWDPQRRVIRPAVGVMLALILLALIGPLFTRDPLMLSAGESLVGPSSDLWFGTDQFGRDIFARAIHGARLDLGVGFSAAALAVVVGMPLGALAALRGGLFDSVLLRISESFQAFPTLLLALGIVAAVGPSIPILILIIAIVNVPVYMRLTRSAVAPIVNADFVLAARCAGQRELTILLRHILPNVKQVVLAQFSVNVAWAIQILAALSFVGLGVPVPTPEWGAMVREGYEQLVYGRWWISLFPGLAILVTVLTLNQLSDRVRHTP
ncbi:MAG: ABC transporter permease [Acidimicrobiia bacterium]|nr:ABC transporter permease [Acidimicrobiia bacterium]